MHFILCIILNQNAAKSNVKQAIEKLRKAKNKKARFAGFLN
jgi:endonuclease III-like uncharacterized protein